MSDNQPYSVNRQQSPKSYADLMSLVGSSGRYQKCVFAGLVICNMVGSFFFYGAPLFFFSEPLKCSQLDIQHCEQYICEFDRQKIDKYIQHSSIFSIAEQFGPFYCQRAEQLNYYRAFMYLVNIFSIFVFQINDKIGTKVNFTIIWVMSILGACMMMLAVNIQVCLIGYVLSILGTTSSYRLSMLILSQICEKDLRQRFIVLILFFYSSFIVLIGVSFYVLNNWKSVIICFCLIPSIAFLIFLILFVQQTPVFLVRTSKQKSVQSLNRIAKINGLPADTVKMFHIENVLDYNKDSQEFRNFQVSFIDLFTYPSLTKISIALAIMTLSKGFLNFGALSILDSLGLDIYTNVISIGIVQGLGVLVIYHFILKVPRNLSLLFTLGGGAFLFFLLIFIHQDKEQIYSWNNFIQLAIVLGTRVCINIYYSISDMYVGQLYPTRIRSLGFGMVSSLAAVSITIANLVVRQFERRNLGSMLLMTVVLLIGFAATATLPETLGIQPKDQIEQIQKQKDEAKNIED